MKRWKNWRKNELHWQELQSRQREIGGLLIKLGDGLTLPGDEDWSEPFTGDDDFKTSNREFENRQFIPILICIHW